MTPYQFRLNEPRVKRGILGETPALIPVEDHHYPEGVTKLNILSQYT